MALALIAWDILMTSEKLKSVLSRFALLIWASLLTMTISYLMVGHWVALPNNQPVLDNDQIVRINMELASQLHVQHILSQSCPCSHRIAKHLASRWPIPSVAEQIVVVESPNDTTSMVFPDAYSVKRISADQLMEEYAIESAPLLLVADSAGKVVYSGGYTARKQGFEIRDYEIISSLLRGESVDALPIYGCAVSKRLRRAVDPLGLKY